MKFKDLSVIFLLVSSSFGLATLPALTLAPNTEVVLPPYQASSPKSKSPRPKALRRPLQKEKNIRPTPTLRYPTIKANGGYRSRVATLLSPIIQGQTKTIQATGGFGCTGTNCPTRLTPLLRGQPSGHGETTTFTPLTLALNQLFSVSIVTTPTTPVGLYTLFLSAKGIDKPVTWPEQAWAQFEVKAIPQIPQITGPSSIWYFFNNLGIILAPSGYPIVQTLTALPSGYVQYRWKIVQSSPAKLSFFDNSTVKSETTTTTNTVKIYSLNYSQKPEDVKVTVEGFSPVTGSYTAASKVFPVSVLTPRRMNFFKQDNIILNLNDSINNPGKKVWQTQVHYKLVNQWCDPISGPQIPVSETFNSGLVDDSPNNWSLLPRNPPQGGVLSVNDIIDTIEPPGLLAGPAPKPLPPGPPPLSTQKIFHFTGSVAAGTTKTDGSGATVQLHTWQFYLDHGAHEKIIRPDCLTK